MSKPKLGSGKRFAALKKKVEGEGKSADSAAAIAASAGIKKYGEKKMGKLAHGMQMGSAGFGMSHGFESAEPSCYKHINGCSCGYC